MESENNEPLKQTWQYLVAVMVIAVVVTLTSTTSSLSNMPFIQYSLTVSNCWVRNCCTLQYLITQVQQERQKDGMLRNLSLSFPAYLPTLSPAVPYWVFGLPAPLTHTNARSSGSQSSLHLATVHTSHGAGRVWWSVARRETAWLKSLECHLVWNYPVLICLKGSVDWFPDSCTLKWWSGTKGAGLQWIWISTRFK